MISLKQLRDCLDSMSPGASPRRRRRRQRRAQGAPAPEAVVAPQPRPRRQRRRRRASRAPVEPSSGVAQGDVVVSRSELLDTVSTDPTSLLLHPDNLPWLKNLAKAFELYRWISVVLEYRPLVGTYSNGAIAMGADWGTQSAKLDKGKLVSSKVAAISREAILAMTPSVDTPQWKPVARLPLPTTRLQGKRWYDCATADGPGYVANISTTNKDCGEVWLHYKVHLTGTRVVA
nr:VP3 [Cat Tien Macrotermes solemo-like virus]